MDLDFRVNNANLLQTPPGPCYPARLWLNPKHGFWPVKVHATHILGYTKYVIYTCIVVGQNKTADFNWTFTIKESSELEPSLWTAAFEISNIIDRFRASQSATPFCTCEIFKAA
jgi:hypothetical protein